VTEANTQPDAAASAEQQIDAQPAGGASATVVGSAAEQQVVGPSDAGLRKAAAQLELPAEVLAVGEPAAQVQAAGGAAGEAGAQHDPPEGGAAAEQLPESAAGAANSDRDFGTVAPVNEALAAVQAAALGISNPIPRAEIAVSDGVGATEAVAQPSLSAAAREEFRMRILQQRQPK